VFVFQLRKAIKLLMLVKHLMKFPAVFRLCFQTLTIPQYQMLAFYVF